MVGYDIGCSFQTTIAASSIGKKAEEAGFKTCVNAFHGHVHKRICQLSHHPLYLPGLGLEDLETCERIFAASNTVARLVHHASFFHWMQFLDLHFDQWDQDKYVKLSKLDLRLTLLAFATITSKLCQSSRPIPLRLTDSRLRIMLKILTLSSGAWRNSSIWRILGLNHHMTS